MIGGVTDGTGPRERRRLVPAPGIGSGTGGSGTQPPIENGAGTLMAAVRRSL